MITEDERFIEIQAILAFSNINIGNCNKINDLIIELSKERNQFKEYTNHNYNKAKQLQQKNKQLKETIDKIYELIKQHIRKDEFLELNEWQTRDLLKLLKEVSE